MLDWLKQSSDSLRKSRSRAKIADDGLDKHCHDDTKPKSKKAYKRHSSPEQRAEAWSQFQNEIAQRTGGRSDNIRGLFEAIDIDANGDVSVKEMRKAFEKLGFETSARALIEHLDADESGQVSLDEWMAAFKEHHDDDGRAGGCAQRLRSCVSTRRQRYHAP